jgi:hypothetical protein
MIHPTSTRIRAAAAALLLLAAGCRFPFAAGGRLDDEANALRAARSRWSANRSGSYTYTVTQLCFCISHPVRVTLQNGQATSVVYADNGQPAAPLDANGVTVDELLSTIDSAIQHDAYKVRATYDDRGVPVDVFIDYDQNTADEEGGWRVSGFGAATTLQ